MIEIIKNKKKYRDKIAKKPNRVIWLFQSYNTD